MTGDTSIVIEPESEAGEPDAERFLAFLGDGDLERLFLDAVDCVGDKERLLDRPEAFEFCELERALAESFGDVISFADFGLTARSTKKHFIIKIIIIIEPKV